MNSIKITMLGKGRFAALYDIKIYRKLPSAQFAVRRYKINSEKIIIDERK